MKINEAMHRMALGNSAIRRKAWPKGVWLHVVYRPGTNNYYELYLQTALHDTVRNVEYSFTSEDICANDWYDPGE